MNMCPICKTGTVKHSSKQVTHTYKERTCVIDLEGEWCIQCHEGKPAKNALKRSRRLVRDFRAEVDGLLTSLEVKNIRKQLNLTQKEAAQICGGGPNAFSRYERGEATPIRATSHLLRLLAKYPDELQRLLAKSE